MALHDTIRRRGPLAGAVLGTALLLSACSAEDLPSEPGLGIEEGFLPSVPGFTDKTSQVINMWSGTWVAALGVALAVWGMVIVCVIVYRKRKDDDRLPVQLRYHVPLEMMFTVIPILMVGTLFFFSARSTEIMQDTEQEPDLVIDIYGKQWSWDFIYTSDGVYHLAGRVALTGEPGVEETLPDLYLPVDQTVQINVHSRDVIHSLWIPAFLYKVDMLPGRVNSFQVTPQEESVVSGKCAELCGEFHSEMLFNVQIVSREEYDAMMQQYRDEGAVGGLDEVGDVLNRDYDLPRYPESAAVGGEN